MKKLILISLLLISSRGFSQIRKEINPNNEGIVLTVGGVAFTAAAILEGNVAYGTYQVRQTSPTTQSHKYVTPPFLRQTPRNIMFGVGISFSIAGLIMLNK